MYNFWQMEDIRNKMSRHKLDNKLFMQLHIMKKDKEQNNISINS